METFSYEAITVATVAIGFTASKLVPDSATPPGQAFVTVETASCRFRMDGSDPTSTEGHLLQVGDSINVTGTQNLYNFRAIRDTATSATLRVSYLH